MPRQYNVNDPSGVYTFSNPIEAYGPREAKHIAVRRDICSSDEIYPYGIDEKVLEEILDSLTSEEVSPF